MEARIENWRLGRIVKLRVAASTMDVARELAEKGFPEWTVVVAEEQTRGRGRLGRKWVSPRGGLWLSLLLRPPSSAIPLLSLVAALAVTDAVRKVCGVEAELKWPNDVVVSERKLAGILVEAVQGSYAIVGIGVNVNNQPPPGIPAVSLSQLTGRKHDLDVLLRELLEAFAERYRQALEAPTALLRDYQARLATLGKRVRVYTVGGDVVEGLAVRVTEKGSLIVETKKGSVEVLAGDVEHLRRAD